MSLQYQSISVLNQHPSKELDATMTDGDLNRAVLKYTYLYGTLMSTTLTGIYDLNVRKLDSHILDIASMT